LPADVPARAGRDPRKPPRTDRDLRRLRRAAVVSPYFLLPLRLPCALDRDVSEALLADAAAAEARQLPEPTQLEDRPRLELPHLGRRRLEADAVATRRTVRCADRYLEHRGHPAVQAGSARSSSAPNAEKKSRIMLFAIACMNRWPTPLRTPPVWMFIVEDT